MQPILKVTNLSKYYGRFLGIKDVSFELYPGEILGFIGPNGAGKSTTIRTLLGLLNYQLGHIELFGQTLTLNNASHLLKDIGYLSSEAKMYEFMKVKDLLNVSLHLSGIKDDTYQKHLTTLLDVPLNKRFSELSFGNRKKVSIVSALQHKPKLLILDEPTNGLDPLMQLHFFAEIKKLNKDHKTTVLLSSHHLKEVENYCDRMMFIKNGALIDQTKIDHFIGQTYTKVSIPSHIALKEDDKISIQSKTDNKLSFIYKGDVKDLLNLLLSLNVDDVEITKPDLEELFVTLYDNDGGNV
jgi:ABC-2 type transport system ATP-binding protein